MALRGGVPAGESIRKQIRKEIDSVVSGDSVVGAAVAQPVAPDANGCCPTCGQKMRAMTGAERARRYRERRRAKEQ